MQVLYVNVHDRSYPRNRLIRSSLAEWSIGVDIVDRRESGVFLFDALSLLWRSIRSRSKYDFVFLSELAVQYALIGRLIAARYRCPLIVDRFVGMHETNVGDWQEVSNQSFKSKMYLLCDWLSARLATLMLIDTDVRADELRRTSRVEVITVPVGAPAWSRPVGDGFGTGRLRVLFYGNYAPLHGVAYMIQSIAQAEEHIERATFVGNGALREKAEQLSRELGIEDIVQFIDGVPEAHLASLIGECDVVLGIFGESPKAAGVIANKVWQGLACGKFVVTRKSNALAEIAPVARESLVPIDVAEDGAFVQAMREVRYRIDTGWAPGDGMAGRLDGYVALRLQDLRLWLEHRKSN